MGKMDVDIACVKTEWLFDHRGYFCGFVTKNAVSGDYYDTVLNYMEYKRRGDLETNPAYKQPIGYCLLVTSDNKVFAYQRSVKPDQYTETRLGGKWSVGIGGHIDDTEASSDDPVAASLIREVREEVGVEVQEFEVYGYINDDTDEVGEVHFGVVARLTVNSDDIVMSEEMHSGGFYTVDELKAMRKEVEFENWSNYIIPSLRSLEA